MSDWKSPRVAIIILAMLLLAGIITAAILRDRIVNQQFRSVTVTGQGKVTYKPDIALVTLGVQIDKIAKPEDTLNQLNTKVASIIKAVKTLGIADENIQTQNYSLYPQYDYKDNISVVSGYNANQQLVIKIINYDKNPGKLNAVIAAASKAGANQVNNLSFDASNMNDLKQQARVLAIADAKSKSTTLASTAGVRLEDIIGWDENVISPVPAAYYDYGKGGAGVAQTVSPSISAGDNEVLIEIGVTYNIK
jgi:uncharacterized protein YggE